MSKVKIILNDENQRIAEMLAWKACEDAGMTRRPFLYATVEIELIDGGAKSTAYNPNKTRAWFARDKKTNTMSGELLAEVWRMDISGETEDAEAIMVAEVNSAFSAEWPVCHIRNLTGQYPVFIPKIKFKINQQDGKIIAERC